MNVFENVPPHVLNPPALYQQAFDEERALAEIKCLTERRDEGEGIRMSACVALGWKFIEARRAMPGVRHLGKGNEEFSAEFKTFVEKSGYSFNTAKSYMLKAKNPGVEKRHVELQRAWHTRRVAAGGDRSVARRKLLVEIRDALLDSTKEEVIDAINMELGNEKAND